MQPWIFSVSNVHHSILRYLWSAGSSLSTAWLICVWQTKWKWKVTKRVLVVEGTRHHRARLLKYYPRCAPILVKSRMLRPLPIHFLHSQQIFFVLVCIRAGNLRVPPVVLASEPNPAGAITRGVLSFWPCRGNKRLVKKKFSLPKFSFKVVLNP